MQLSTPNISRALRRSLAVFTILAVVLGSAMQVDPAPGSSAGGYSGYWTLVESKHATLSRRKSSKDEQHDLLAEVEKAGPLSYAGTVDLSDYYVKWTSDKESRRVYFTYGVRGIVAWDPPPLVVPNGTNWDVRLEIRVDEGCYGDWAEIGEAVRSRLGSPTLTRCEGARPRHVDCYAAVERGEANRVRARTDDDLAPSGPTRYSAGSDEPWADYVPVRFTLIPEFTVSTAEQFILHLTACTPAGMFVEQYVYAWTRELPEHLATDLSREIDRVNFCGVRSGRPDVSGGGAAEPTAMEKPTKIAQGSKAKLAGLRYAPVPIVVKREASFELQILDGPKVPSVEWAFGETGHIDSWTTTPLCKYTYFRPGTFTVTVRVRDKDRYARGHVAAGAWEVTVVPEDAGAAPPKPARTGTGDAPPSDAIDAMADDIGPLRLTHPAGRSPKAFTSGWVFGVECVVNGPDGERIDLSSKVRWSGSGWFRPEVGSRSRPAFHSAGWNTITLTVEIGGKTVQKTYKVEAIRPVGYATVGGLAQCEADSHGCMACPHVVVGPITTGSSLVLIGGKPAARAGDVGVHAACCGANTFEIVGGDPGVLIDGRPAARVGSPTKHCGGTGSIISTGQ